MYTSADCVLQIAAHEDVVPVELLYQWCQAARDIMQGPYQIGRVIARPFIGKPGRFVRTPRRHDYAIIPPTPTMVDHLNAAGVRTIAVGKIGDIFSKRGFARHLPTTSNLDGLKNTEQLLGGIPPRDEFIFVNLVEFDSHYGHRRDPQGYAQALADLDNFLPRLWQRLGPNDQLWITADHGCDPTYRGTDHTRETLLWLAFGPSLVPGIGEPRHGLHDIAATLGALFDVPVVGDGLVAPALVTRSQ